MDEQNEEFTPEELAYNPFAPQPRGKALIRVTGVLLIIFGIFSITVSLIGLISSIKANSDAGIIITVYFELVVAACAFGAGIGSVKNAGVAAKAQGIIVLGIILCALRVIDLILGLAIFRLSAGGNIFILAAVGFVLSVLLIIGGLMNKKGAPV